MLRATERRVLIGFGFALAVLAVVATASIASIRTLRADSESLQRSRQAIGRLELALSSTLEVGTALRGYLLTREDSILAPLAHVNQTVDSLLALLREPDERDVVQVDSIGLLVHERVAVADSIILLQRTHGDSAARAEWSHGRGVQLQAMIARLVRTLQETERTRADARGSAADRNARRATTVIATSAGLGLALTMAAVVLLHGGFRRARESEAALRASNALLDSRVQERTAQLERAVTDLEASEERLRTAVSSIPQQVWVCESDGSCSFASARWLEYSGASMDALVGNGWLAQVHPNDRDAVVHAWSQAVQHGDPFHATCRIRAADATYRWFDMRAMPVRAADGSVSRWFGANTDIHVARELEHTLHAERERLGTIASVAPVLLMSFRRRANGTAAFEYAGPLAEHIYGFTPAALAENGDLVGSRVHAADAAAVAQRIAHSVATLSPWHGQYRYNHPARGEIWLEGHLSPSRDQDGSIIWHGVVVEATDRVRAEQSVRLWAGAFEHCAHGLAIGDSKSNTIRECNPAYAAMLGRRVDEIIGTPILSLHAPSQRERVREILAEADWRGKVQLESEQSRADGTLFPVQIDIVSVRDPQGEPAFRVATIQDIGERRKHIAELGRRAIALARSNMDLEQFAYVASHDLQEPLRAVAGCVQLLQKRYGDKLDARAVELIDFAVDGALRMQRLINDLLDYSRIGRAPGHVQMTDSAASLASALANLTSLITETRAVVTHDPMPMLATQASQLTSVLQNLIANSIKFRGATAPTIHVGAQRRDGLWEFSVRDNGIGIAPQHFDRIFGIFQRLHTRDEYPGTGIGLAACKRVVEQHGGRIWVESTPGQGATFFFTIPDAATASNPLQ